MKERTEAHGKSASSFDIYNKHPTYPHFATRLPLDEERFCTTYVRYSIFITSFIITSFYIRHIYCSEKRL